MRSTFMWDYPRAHDRATRCAWELDTALAGPASTAAPATTY